MHSTVLLFSTITHVWTAGKLDYESSMDWSDYHEKLPSERRQLSVEENKPAYLIKQSARKWDRLVHDHDARTSTVVRLLGRVYQEEEGEREFLIGSTMRRKMLQQKQSTKRERESERKRTLWIGAGWSEIIFLLLVASKVHPHQAQTVCTARSLREA